MLNNDYKDILLILSEKKVKFLLVGAYAMAIHGYPRSTMDIDLWVMPDPENAELVLQALESFGAPVKDLSVDDLQKNDIVFQVGIAPRRIDIITSIDGLSFEDAYTRSQIIDIEGISIHVLSIPDLIINKQATGRKKDLADIESLANLSSE
jgi:predicted nucleotidyltransferase